jgi:hypothetical protein
MQIPRSLTGSANPGIPNVSTGVSLATFVSDHTSRQQWMFVTDTIDAVYRPEDWTPESLLDQLAEMVTDLPEQKVRAQDRV